MALQRMRALLLANGLNLPSAYLNGNELHLEVSPEQAVAVTQLIHHRLDAPLVSMFASDERPLNGNFAIYYTFGIKSEHCLVILKTLIPEETPEFQSITDRIPGAQLYEREIKDLFGLTPLGHPLAKPLVWHGNWPEGLYPLRKDFDGRQPPPWVDREETFTHVHGPGVFEVPVGPVHAGIIEPGHFRFSIAGEPIINLEAQLYYVHKGIEKLAEGRSIEFNCLLAERISGDESFTNSLAFSQAVERIAGLTLPERADYSRVIFAELERLVCHLGDLAGICIDVAFGFAAFQFRMLRGWTYQLIEETCGSRFLRSINQPGGLRRDFINSRERSILEALERIERELKVTEENIRSNSLFIDRVEHTGILPNTVAVDLNAVGPAGRASGVRADVRRDFPYAAYDRLNFTVPEHYNGDVNCRMNVKLEECYTAIDLIRQALAGMPAGPVAIPLTTVPPFQAALGYTEAPRGENIHWVMTAPENTIYRYKIRTPSFCNWPVLCQAVKGNIIPDFPLINKSFNLSYAGNDL